MPFPATIEELEKAGYTRQGGSSGCRGCGAMIEWWRTPKTEKAPNGKLMPMNFGTAIPHWSTCPQSKAFKEKKV